MTISQLDLVLLGGRAITSRLGSIESALRGVSLGLFSGDTTGNVPAVRPNLLSNSSFEFYHRNDSKPQDWNVSGSVTLIPNATGADGTTSLQLAAGANIQQQVAGGMVFPQGAFVLSVAVKTQYAGQLISLNVTHIPGVTLNTIQRLSTTGDLTNSAEVPADGQWYRFFVQGLLTGGADVTAIIGCSGGAGTIEIDAAKFEFEAGEQSHIDPTAYQGGDWGGAGAIRNFKADNIVAGTLTVGGSSSEAPEVSVLDSADNEIVTIGDRDGDTYGVHVKGEGGILVSGSGSVEVTGGGDVAVTGGGSVTVSGGGKVKVDTDGSIVAGTEGAQRTEMSAEGIVGYNADNEVQVQLDSDDGRLKVLGPGSVVVQGGGSLLAGAEGANRLEVREQGIFVYDINNVEKVSISTVDGIVRIDADAFIVDGTVNFDSLDVDGEVIVGQDLRVGANVLFVDQDQGNVGINKVPDPQFDLDVQGNFRAGGYIVGKHAIQLDGATLISHFDGPPPYETNFTGNADAHLGQKATAEGGVIFRPGKFNKGVQVAEGTTNYVQNPSAEVDATTNVNLLNMASVRYTGDAVFGDACFEFTAADLSNYVWWSSTSATPGEVFTVSMYVKGTPGERVLLRFHDGAEQSDGELFTLNGKWQRITHTATVSPSGTGAAPWLELAEDTGQVVLVDGVQLEKKAYATPYCDGSLGSGHAWVGTTGLSQSTRSQASLYWPNPIKAGQPFTVMFWQDTPWSVVNPNYTAVSYGWGSTTGQFRIAVGVDGITLQWYSDEASYQQTFDATIDSESHIAVTYDGSSIFTVYLNGVQLGTMGAPGSLVGASRLWLGALGSDSAAWAGGNGPTAWYDDLVVLGRVIEQDELRAVIESDAPVFAETSTWGWRTPNTLAWADHEGLWAIDASGNAAFGVSGVDGKSWGNIGSNIDAGDVVIGNNTNYVWWDASAGTIRFRGDGSGLTSINGGNIQTGTIGADKISVTQLSAISANLGSITAGTVTGATIQTAASGARVVLNSTGLTTYNASNQSQVYISTATGGQLHAANGRIRLGSTGIVIGAANYGGYQHAPTDSIVWMMDANYTTRVATIQGYTTNLVNFLDLRVPAVAGRPYCTVYLSADGTTGGASVRVVGANIGTERGQVEINTNGGYISLTGGPVYVQSRIEFGLYNGPYLYHDSTNNGIRASANVLVNGNVYANDWFRVNGTGGIYWQLYGGGWQMYDNWIRNYGSKPVWIGGSLTTHMQLQGPEVRVHFSNDSGNVMTQYWGGGKFNFYNNRAGVNILTVWGDTNIGRVGIRHESPAWALHVGLDSCAKPNGGSWINSSSDIRTKTVLGEYEYGLEAVKQLHLVRYEYNGRGGTEKGLRGVGFIAQEAQEVIPEMVHTRMAKLDPEDEHETELLALSNDPAIYATIKAVQELAQMVEDLQTEVARLKGTA